MADLMFRQTTSEDAVLTRKLMEQYWGGEPLVIRARKYYPSKLDGIIVSRGNDITGFLFYDLRNSACEIVVFEVLDKFKGIGTAILNKLKHIVKQKGCNRIFLMTTNDNLEAMRFYQKRGFYICGIHLDSVKESRRLKPGILLTGEHGIPLRDEIDLEFTF